jgi:hypothetical protein
MRFKLGDSYNSMQTLVLYKIQHFKSNKTMAIHTFSFFRHLITGFDGQMSSKHERKTPKLLNLSVVAVKLLSSFTQ